MVDSHSLKTDYVIMCELSCGWGPRERREEGWAVNNGFGCDGGRETKESCTEPVEAR